MTSQDIKKTIVDKWMPLFFGITEEPCCWLCEQALFNCLFCIIFSVTGAWNCHETPYWSWRDKPCRETAREELLFLLRLYRKVRKGEINGYYPMS